MSHGPDTSAILAGTPRAMPKAALFGGIAAVVVGVLCLSLGLASNIERTMGAFLTSLVYSIGLSQGGFMLAVAFVPTNARWGRPLKRIAESFILYMPILYILLLGFMLLGGLEIYPWTHEELPPHKSIWLREGFFVARLAVTLGVLQVLSLLFLRSSLRADLGVAARKLGDRAPSWWSHLIGDWKGDDEERAIQNRFQHRIAPVIIVCYAYFFSLFAVDVEMSLSPHWYANMFPGWFFMSCVWLGIVWIGLYSQIAKHWLGLGRILGPRVYHDLGKLTFGFCMFWGYTTFAQYLAIWYGNMTEEIGYILLRTHVEPWATLSKVVVLTCFLIPWTMFLSRSLKKIPTAYITVASLIAVGLWLERFLVIIPGIWKEETLPLGVPEVGIAIGFVGGFVLVVTWFLSRVPPMPLNDEYLAPHPDEIHVHPGHVGAHAK